MEFTLENNEKESLVDEILKELTPQEKKEIYGREFEQVQQIFLDECCATKDQMDDIYERYSRMIDSRTKRPYTSYKHKIHIKENDDKLKASSDAIHTFTRSYFLQNKNFKNQIIRHYKILNYFVKLYQPKNQQFWVIELCW
jgi:hypothetical protein